MTGDWRHLLTHLLTYSLTLITYYFLPIRCFFRIWIYICFILCTWTSPVVEVVSTSTTSIFDGANARNRSGKLKQPLIKMLRPCDEKIVRQWSSPPLLIFGGALRAAPPCLVAVAWLSLFQRFQKRNGVRGSPFAGHSTIPLLPPEQRRRSPLRAHRPADTA